MHATQQPLTYVPFNNHPVQLWIGSESTVISEVEHLIQKLFCKNNGCTFCVECHKIRTRQHHALMWITPEKTYTRDLIEPILHTISLQLAPQEQFFFVLQNADFLTENCANALLKLIEEPPHGYRFILMAERKQMVLPTIRSRCIIYTLNQNKYAIKHQSLFDHFTKQNKLSAQQFIAMLETADINERESIELLDGLLEYWRKQIHQTIQNNNTIGYKTTMQIMHILLKAIQKPPMPGSSKLLWKNLFLQI